MLNDKNYQHCARKGSLKGLLKAFKGKGELQALAQELRGEREHLLQLQPVLQRAVQELPVRYLPLVLCSNPARSGVSYLRWRNLDNNHSGDAALQEILQHPDCTTALSDAMEQIELQRQVLNMQLAVVVFILRRLQPLFVGHT